jgi:hypothetical protein
MHRQHDQSSDEELTDSSTTEPQSPGPLHDPDPDDNTTAPGGDQDIDTAGTDADDQSPTKAMGTGLARPRSRG